MYLPKHNCPIQGENTDYVQIVNIQTNEKKWGCIFCEMAKKMGQEVPDPPEFLKSTNNTTRSN